LLRDFDPAMIPEGLLVPEDNWAPPLLEIVGDGDMELADLVVHLSALSGPRPAKKWRTECLRLLRPDRAREFVLAGLGGLAECEPAFVTGGYLRREYRAIVCEQNSLVARGVVWAAALLPDAGVVAGLAAVALRTGETRRDIAQEFKVAGAAINAVGESTDPAALEALWTLRSRIRHRSLRRQLDAAIAAAAQRHGITPAELTERSVPDHGVGPDGTLAWHIGQYIAAVTIEGSRTARLTFRAPDGRVARGVPAPVAEHFPGETAGLKTLVRQVRSTLAAECRRLESVLATHRTWPFGIWQRHYLSHPVTGAIARDLIWELKAATGEWISVLPGRDGLTGADGQSLSAPAEATRVRLWRSTSSHPPKNWQEAIQADSPGTSWRTRRCTRC
jgi:hypothetical protein